MVEAIWAHTGTSNALWWGGYRTNPEQCAGRPACTRFRDAVLFERTGVPAALLTTTGYSLKKAGRLFEK
jgi:hypothetical protein